MSNTATKINSYIYLGYSILSSQKNAADRRLTAVADVVNLIEMPQYQYETEENILPDAQQVMQTVIPINPSILKI